jgi:hypothetical protein
MKKVLLFLFGLNFALLLNAQVYKTISCAAGKLSTLITNDELEKITNLTITGTIDARDFKTMRDNMPVLSELDMSAVTINTYFGSQGPDDYNNTQVYAANTIPACAFSKPIEAKGKESLTKVKLPQSTTVIGDYSFHQCKQIQTFEIPGSVVIIGAFALQGLKLTSIKIPSKVIEIGSGAFYEFNGDINVDVDNSKYSSIDGVLFDKTASTILQCPVSKTGSYSLPASVTQIGTAAFSECKQLTEVILAPKVTTIEYSAFFKCTNLKRVTLPASLTRIMQGAFSNCINLESITLPERLIKIEDGIFYECEKLKIVNLSPSTIEIGSSVFLGCSSIETITIPATLTKIGKGAFQGCSGDVLVNPNNPTYSSIDGVLYDKAKTIIHHCSISKTGIFEILPTVKVIAEYAFFNCKHITSFTMPQSVIEIKEGAFGNCNGLTTFETPANLKTIGNYVFSVCEKMKTLVISENVESIGDGAFFYCQELTSIYCKAANPIDINLGQDVFTGVYKPRCTLFVPIGSIPAYRAASQWQEFYNIIEMPAESNINSTAGGLAALIPQNIRDTLTTLEIKGAIDARDFKFMRDSLPSLAELDMSAATINTYVGTQGTDDYNQSTVYAANTIPACAFSFPNNALGKESLTKVVLPLSATVIGDKSFFHCKGIQSLVMPNSLTIIGHGGLQGLNLDSIYIPSSVKQIGNGAFFEFNGNIYVDANNQKYSSIDGVLFDKTVSTILQCPISKSGSYSLPTTVTKVGFAAFLDCEELTEVVLPSKVTIIEASAFLRCKNLKSVLLPPTLRVIQSSAFSDCVNLESINLPISLNEIEFAAFNECKKIQTIHIPSSITIIGSYVFSGCSNLETVTLPASVIKIGQGAFNNCSSLSSVKMFSNDPISLKLTDEVFIRANINNCILTVPFGAMSAYQQAEVWKDFKNIIEMQGIQLDKTELDTVSYWGDELEIKVTSNIDWKISASDGWVQVVQNGNARGNSTVNIHVSQNLAFEPRTAKIDIVTTESNKITIEVNQKAGVETLIVSADIVRMGRKDDRKDLVYITSNTEWIAISDQAWLTLSPNEAVNGNSTITLTAEENTGLERTATVIVKSVIGNKTIVVTQEGHKVGLEKRELETISVYPNPVADQLHINGFKGKATLQLFEMTGKNVFSSELSNQSVISMTKFRQGIYLLRITTIDGIKEQKIVKQ